MGKCFKNFEDAAQEDVDIFVDSGIAGISGMNWYTNFVYGARQFAHLNIDIFREVIENTNKVNNFLFNSNVYTSSKTAKELEDFSKIISDKYELLKLRGYIPQGNSKKELRDYEEGKALFSDLTFAFNNLKKRAQKKVFTPAHNRAFTCLENLVKNVGKQNGAKIKNVSYDNEPKTYSKSDTGADEELVAVAMCNSIINSRNSFLFTKDSDLRRLFFGTIEAFFKEPSCAKIRHRLTNNPVVTYYIEPDDCARCTGESNYILKELKERIN